MEIYRNGSRCNDGGNKEFERLLQEKNRRIFGMVQVSVLQGNISILSSSSCSPFVVKKRGRARGRRRYDKRVLRCYPDLNHAGILQRRIQRNDGRNFYG